MLNAGFDEQGVTCKMLNDMFGTILTNGGLSNKHPGTDEEAGDVFGAFYKSRVPTTRWACYFGRTLGKGYKV